MEQRSSGRLHASICVRKDHVRANERYIGNRAEQRNRCGFDNAMHLIGRLSNPSESLARLLDGACGRAER